MIKINIKPNYAGLGCEYGCDYRTTKKRYNEVKIKKMELKLLKKQENILDIYNTIRLKLLENYTEIFLTFKIFLHQFTS